LTATTDEDADLVAGFVDSGRMADFELLVARHRDAVFRVALAVLGPGRARYAEDVVQEVFVDVYRKLSTFEGRSRFSTWLYRIAYNRAVDYRRSMRLELERDVVIEAVDQLAPADVLRSRAVADCLSRLPETQRAVVHLHYWFGETVLEISAALGVQPGTVKAWLFRARHALARCLAAKGVGHDS
jgi:RNA polymerase sigma-70 factor (ECF subfamily)